MPGTGITLRLSGTGNRLLLSVVLQHRLTLPGDWQYILMIGKLEDFFLKLGEESPDELEVDCEGVQHLMFEVFLLAFFTLLQVHVVNLIFHKNYL